MGVEKQARTGLDVRLVPTAIVLWAATAAAIVRPVAAIVAVVAAVVMVAMASVMARAVAGHKVQRQLWLAGVIRRWNAYAMLPLVGSMAAAVGVGLRKYMVARHELVSEVGGIAKLQVTLKSAPRVTEIGAMAQAKVAGLPGRVWVYGNKRMLAYDQGTLLEISAVVKEASRASVSGLRLTVRGEPKDIGKPAGLVAQVRSGMREESADMWTGADRLLPAMTLGDERGFTIADHTMMTNAGLSHLTAVSGANVMLVVGVVMAVMSWSSPRARVVGAAVTLAAFVAVVGTEPSVLRAVLTGSVGLMAIVMGRRGQAIPALAGGVIILLLVSPDLAVSVGFMLSVSATAGLVLLAEPLARRLISGTVLRCWPAPVVRGISVAVVAHVVTLPVLALFVGEFSHASIVANLAVAPAVPPVTILGTLAAVSLAFGAVPVADLLLWLAAPCAWWVYFVAGIAARAGDWIGLGSGTVPVGASIVTLFVLWKWPRVCLRALVTLTILSLPAGFLVWALGLHIPRAPAGWIAAACEVDGRTVLINSPESAAVARHSRTCRIALSLHDADVTAHLSPQLAHSKVVANPKDVDAGVEEAQWYVAKQCGERIRRVIVTPQGMPVVCPARDGPQALMPDSSVWRGW